MSISETRKKTWSIAEKLRNEVGSWDMQNYILTLLFYRYISEKGLITSEKEKFSHVLENASEYQNLGETLSNIFKSIENIVGRNIKRIFDDFDVSSNKLGSTVELKNEKLRVIMEAIADMDISNSASDVFGDMYECLLGMYASEARKIGGQYFTPPEVSELLMTIVSAGKGETLSVYDPTCGSGSLLLKAKKVLKNAYYFGQEINPTTYNLCRMNMIVHDIPLDHFSIACGDTLVEPNFTEYTDIGRGFDLIVSNPPYSVKWAGNSDPKLVNDKRFSPAGVLAPKSKADLAFIMHCLSYLSKTGTAAIVCFPGVLYRGSAEQKIRKYLIDNNFVECVIGMPNNLFFSTQISTCILVLKKNKTSKNTLFIDASGEFVDDGNKNKLSDENIHHIFEAYRNKKEIPNFSKLVSQEEIAENGYNLSVSTYVEPKAAKEEINIDKLEEELEVLATNCDRLRKEIEAITESLR